MQSFRGHLLTLLATMAFALAFLIGLLTWSGVAPWGGGYEVRVMVPTAGSMGSGANVRIAGLPVGKVTKVERRGPAALLELKLTDAKTPIPEDTRAAVRLRTLVGENYVELYPGRSRRTLEDGGILPMSQTNDFVEADEILSVLRGKTRERAQKLIQGFGTAVDGQGRRLNSLLEHSAGTIDAANDVTAILARDHEEVARLVQDVGSVTRAIGDRTQSLRQLASTGRATFQSLADRDEALKSTLEQLPSTLSQVRTTSQLLQSVTGRSAPVVAKLASAVDELDPVVGSLGPATREGRAILARLSTAAPRLEGTLGRLRKLAPPTVQALPEVRKVLCELNPAAEYLSPFGRDLAAMLTNMGSVTNYYDATGHAARLFILGGQGSFGAIGDDARKALNTLQDFGIVNEFTKRGYNPYPAPGTGGRPGGIGDGASGPADSKIKYTRVQAEC